MSGTKGLIFFSDSVYTVCKRELRPFICFRSRLGNLPSTLILEGKRDDEVKKCAHAVHFPIKSTTTPATRASSFCSIPPLDLGFWHSVSVLLLLMSSRPEDRGKRNIGPPGHVARATRKVRGKRKHNGHLLDSRSFWVIIYHASLFFFPCVRGIFFWGPLALQCPETDGWTKEGGPFSYPPVPGLVIAFYWCPFLGKEGQAYMGGTGHFGGPPLSSWEERKNPKAGPGRMRGNTFCPFRPLKKDHILIQKRTHSRKEKSKPSTCI